LQQSVIANYTKYMTALKTISMTSCSLLLSWNTCKYVYAL